MPSILVTVFILQLVIHIVNTLGVATINNLLWSLYTSLTSPKFAAEHRELKSQFMKVRTEMNSTSSQDEFAKWAKLRRQHDKLFEQLEKMKSSSEAAKGSFNSAVSTLRWLGTTGLRMFIQYWYVREPMFWIPHGWVPFYAEWLLSFPRAPVGSISINVWVLACGAIITLVHDALAALIGLFTKSGAEKRGAPMAQAAGGEGKKEL